eukprot:5135700-Pleurochrysis_carterae.AAC.1
MQADSATAALLTDISFAPMHADALSPALFVLALLSARIQYVTHCTTMLVGAFTDSSCALTALHSILTGIAQFTHSFERPAFQAGVLS